MEKSGVATVIPGSRLSDLKKAYKSAVRSLLTACSKQDFLEIFSEFSRPEQEVLYRLYTQVVVKLHQTLEDEFDKQCHQTQVGTVLDKVDQLIEEQSLDPLFPTKTNVMDVANDLRTAKTREIQKLTDMLQKAEEENRQKEARINLLRNQKQDLSGPAKKIEKLKSGISSYLAGNDKLPPI